MKKLFKAIRQKDNDLVVEILNKKPQLIDCIAKTPPKKDDGQSPLQVAFKCKNFNIANLLIKRGANVNFIETESINDWKTPVVHDALRAAVFSCRFITWGVKNTKEDANIAFETLKTLIEAGADVKETDSHKNTCLQRVIWDAEQCSLTPTFISDVQPIIDLLVEKGLDPVKAINRGDFDRGGSITTANLFFNKYLYK